jgi:hypothetical protein
MLAPIDDAAIERSKKLHLLFATDQLGAKPLGGRPVAKTGHQPSRLRVEISGGGQRDRLVLGHELGRLVGSTIDQDPASGRSLLQARREVDDLPRYEELSRGNSGRIGDHFAGANANANAQLGLGVRNEHRHPLLHRGSSTDRPLGVIFMYSGNPKDRHDRIAYKLLDHATVALDFLAHGGEILTHKRPHPFWVDAASERGGVHHIGKEHTDDPSFRGCNSGKGGATVQAKVGFPGILCTAGGASER